MKTSLAGVVNPVLAAVISNSGAVGLLLPVPSEHPWSQNVPAQGQSSALLLHREIRNQSLLTSAGPWRGRGAAWTGDGLQEGRRAAGLAALQESWAQREPLPGTSSSPNKPEPAWH